MAADPTARERAIAKGWREKAARLRAQAETGMAVWCEQHARADQLDECAAELAGTGYVGKPA